MGSRPSKRGKAAKSHTDKLPRQASKALEQEARQRHKAIEKAIEKAIKEADKLNKGLQRASLFAALYLTAVGTA